MLLHQGSNMTLFAFIIWSAVLIAIAIYDYKTYLILDWLNGLCAAVSLFLAYFLEHTIQFVAFGILAGITLPTALNWICLHSKHRARAIGNGDVKFLAAVGSALGATGIWLALLTACMAAITVNRGKSIYIPFGPFLVAGCFTALGAAHLSVI